MPKTTSTTPPLTGDCHNCYRPAVYYPERDEYLCPDCATYYHRYEDALEHLKALLQPLTTAWVAHWRARGLSAQEIGELLQEAVELPEGEQRA